MKRPKLFMVLGCVLLMACNADMSLRQMRETEQAIESQLDTWVRALNNKELDTLLALHMQLDDLRVIRPDGSVMRGWEQEEAAHTAMFDAMERMNFVAQRPEIQILTPEYAITTFGHSTDVINEGGERDTPTSGNVTSV